MTIWLPMSLGCLLILTSLTFLEIEKKLFVQMISQSDTFDACEKSFFMMDTYSDQACLPPRLDVFAGATHTSSEPLARTILLQMIGMKGDES
jgi:hypothetical protein